VAGVEYMYMYLYMHMYMYVYVCVCVLRGCGEVSHTVYKMYIASSVPVLEYLGGAPIVRHFTHTQT